jgi:DNA-binding response OmpR family regulator
MILLVEDEPFVRQATCSILEHAGFAVLSAEDVRDAQKVYTQRSGRIDLVMTDMMLPGGTGAELGRDLRVRSPEVQVLIVSGYPDAGGEEEAATAPWYFLAKPYSRRTLLDKIEAILATAPLRRRTILAS